MQLSKKMSAVLAGSLMLMSLGTVSAVAQHNDHKTTICHKTGQPNKFVRISVDDHALAAHQAHQNGGDIIPAPDNGMCPGDDATPPDTKDVVICHRTDDDEPFEKITVQEGPELQAHLDHGDVLPDPDTQECPPVEDDDDDDDGDDDGCSNENSGTSVLQSVNLVAAINILGLGENEQNASASCGDDDDEGGSSNENSGTSLAQLINTALPINILGIGSNTQSAVTP